MDSGIVDYAPKDEVADELGLVHPCWLYCGYRNTLCVLVSLLPSRLDDDSPSRLAEGRHMRRELRGRGGGREVNVQPYGEAKDPGLGNDLGVYVSVV